MKSGRPLKYGIGYIIGFCLLVIEAVINVRTGKLTGMELFTVIVLCTIFGVVMVALAKRIIRKRRERFRSTKTETQEQTDDAQNNE